MGFLLYTNTSNVNVGAYGAYLNGWPGLKFQTNGTIVYLGGGLFINNYFAYHSQYMPPPTNVSFSSVGITFTNVYTYQPISPSGLTPLTFDFALGTNDQRLWFIFPHGLGHTPQNVQWNMVCVNTDSVVGYYPGNVLSLPLPPGAGYGGLYTTEQDATNCMLYTGSPFLGSEDFMSVSAGWFSCPLNGTFTSGSNTVYQPHSFSNFKLRCTYYP
jgi:hypothetical protein